MRRCVFNINKDISAVLLRVFQNVAVVVPLLGVTVGDDTMIYDVDAVAISLGDYNPFLKNCFVV